MMTDDQRQEKVAELKDRLLDLDFLLDDIDDLTDELGTAREEGHPSAMEELSEDEGALLLWALRWHCMHSEAMKDRAVDMFRAKVGNAEAMRIIREQHGDEEADAVLERIVQESLDESDDDEGDDLAEDD